MDRKKANRVKYFKHKLSKTMVDNAKATTIIVGDLSVQQIAQPKVKASKKEKKTKLTKGQNRCTPGLGNLGRFVQFLTYKTEIVGKSVIRIDEKYTLRNIVIVGKSMICFLEAYYDL
jgi:putative transposase